MTPDLDDLRLTAELCEWLQESHMFQWNPRDSDAQSAMILSALLKAGCDLHMYAKDGLDVVGPDIAYLFEFDGDITDPAIRRAALVQAGAAWQRQIARQGE
jgi:hypothetical protein